MIFVSPTHSQYWYLYLLCYDKWVPAQQWRCRFFVDAHMQCHADCLHSQCATCAGWKGGETFPCAMLPSQGHLHVGSMWARSSTNVWVYYTCKFILCSPRLLCVALEHAKYFWLKRGLRCLVDKYRMYQVSVYSYLDFQELIQHGNVPLLLYGHCLPVPG